MNILPKKSWHVRNKDNVAKVRKDEENARKQAAEQNQRAAAAQQEAKINYLRDKARNRIIENSSDLLDTLKDYSGHSTPSCSRRTSSIAGQPSSNVKNEEHELEKRKEELEYEKRLGVLKYLGQGAAETMDDCDKPWYFRTPKRKIGNSTEFTEETDERESKRKLSLDPINMMKIHVEKKRHSDKDKLEKVKKHRRKKKSRHRYHEDEKNIVDNSDKLTRLRKERLERERKEKQRTSILINGDEKPPARDAFPGKYNSQYNPHLVRSRVIP